VSQNIVLAEPRRVARQRWSRSDGFLATVLLAPAIVYIAALIGFPLLLALYLSLSNATTGSQTLQYVGWANFARAIDSSIFRSALTNTIVFTVVSQVIVIVLGNILALTLLENFVGRPVVRFLILLPWAAPVALGAIGWKWMFDSLYSVVNWMLRAAHIIGPRDFPQWLGVTDLAMAAIITVHVWRMLPFSAVVLMAGLTSIPQEILDAAAVDGAGFFDRLFRIVLPMLLPIVLVAVLFGTVFTSTDLATVFILTQGGPFNTTHVLASWAFQKGIIAGDLAEGAAIALFLLPVLLVVAVIMLRMASRSEGGA
jgi:multiple sugar transport system permease protein